MRTGRLLEVLTRSGGMLSLAASIALAVGCQQNPTNVVGVVLLDGKPLDVADDSRGTIVFQSVGGQGTSPSGVLDSTGHFQLATGASAEVAPGKYRVAVSIVQLLPAADHMEQGAKRITPAKYASANTSDLEAEVVPGSNDFKFDLVPNTDDVTQSPSQNSAATEAQSAGAQSREGAK